MNAEELNEFLYTFNHRNDKRYRIILAIDNGFPDIEKAKDYAEELADDIKDQLLAVRDPRPKILDVYEVKE